MDYELRFPEDISFNAVGGSGWLTDIVAVESGFEYRNQSYSQPRGSWEVSHAARLPEQYHRLRAFFNIMEGRTHSFRFKDWTDYTVSPSEGVFVASTGSPSGYRLAKRYSFDGYTFDRRIYKPVQNITFVGGSGVSVDYTNGFITYSSAPTAWYGEFDVPVRFDVDEMKAETLNKTHDGLLIIGWSSIQLREIRIAE